jgi:uncharacterized protein (TIGR02246 family)
MVLAVGFMACLVSSAFAQKAEIVRVNAQWMNFFNKGDFVGVASLYTDDATAPPPGSAMAKGRASIRVMWERMAEQVTDPRVTTLEVKSLGPRAAYEIGNFSLKSDAKRSHGEVRCGLAKDQR